MASVEIREGFLCPMCMQDLGTVSQLQSHFEEEHSEDKDVLDQLKGLFDKAKRRILKKEREEDSGGGGTFVREEKAANTAPPAVDRETTAQWETQELGATRPHTDYFKRVRDTRIDRCVIETNKLLIRLDKLLGPDLPADPGKRKAFEKAVVPWAADSDVQACPGCDKRFTITRRRHHCRLCGGIMCNKCSQFMPAQYARKLTNPAFQYDGAGFHRSNSNSSINSMFSPDGDLHIRTCGNCRTLLERRDQQMEQRNTKPLLVQLYEKMKKNITETDRLLKYFLKMSEDIRSGETTYSLEDANLLRVKIMKLYESIDSLSKRIMKLGTDQLDPPSVPEIQLQTKVRLYARNYLQEHLMGLQALPTAEEYEKLKEARRQEIQQKIEAEKQAAAERSRLAKLKELREQRDQDRGSPQPQRPIALEVQGHRRQGSQGFVQDEGWKPSEVTHGAVDDPMVQQMNIIKGYIKQAKMADRWDEVRTLELNLRELQQAYWSEKERTERAGDNTQKPPTLTSHPGGSAGSSPSEGQGQADPMIQQMTIIKGYIKQAKEDGRWDEVYTFEQNLRELREAYQLAKEEDERSLLQSPLQTNAPPQATHQSHSQYQESSPKPQPFPSHKQQEPHNEPWSSYFPGQGNPRIEVQSGAKPKESVTTPVTTNPFDEDYNEDRVTAYVSGKYIKR